MDAYTLGFFALSALLVVISMLCVASRRLVHYILFLFLFVIVVSAFFIYLNAIFLSLAELIIYNGGIVVLLAIAIFLMPEGEFSYQDKKYIFILPLLILAFLSFLLYNGRANPVTSNLNYSGLGYSLFTDYGPLLALLAITAIATLISSIYLITKEDKHDTL